MLAVYDEQAEADREELAAIGSMVGDLRRYAKLIGATRPGHEATIRGRVAVYPSTHHFIIANHKPLLWSPHNADDGPQRGQIGACYFNAAFAVLRDPGRYVYCEGLAAGYFPMGHAWVYDRKIRRIVDVTWNNPEGDQDRALYVGVPFKTSYLKKVFLRKSDHFCMIDRWWDSWPLLTGVDTVDEAVETRIDG